MKLTGEDEVGCSVGEPEGFAVGAGEMVGAIETLGLTVGAVLVVGAVEMVGAVELWENAIKHMIC